MTAENSEQKPPGSDCRFESREAPFQQLGIKVRVLEPGQPNGIYHSESPRTRALTVTWWVAGRGGRRSASGE